VEQAGEHHVLHLGRLQAQPDGDLAGQVGDPPRVAADRALAQLDEVGEHPDRGQEVLLELLVGAAQLGGAGLDLLLEAGVEAAQLFVLGLGERLEAGFSRCRARARAPRGR
jgi:hypothetical protein